MAKHHWWSRRERTARGLDAGVAVIGTEHAAATAAEAEHRTVDHGPSPLADVVYRTEDHDLLQLTRPDADARIAAVVEQFAAQDRAGRAALTTRLTMEDQYLLVSFARRCSVRARQDDEPEVAALGAEALAMIDSTRVDWRDLLWAGQLVAYALDRMDADRAAVFRRAASLASGRTIEPLEGLAEDDGLDLVELGYREVRTADGIGLIADGGDDYDPRADLVGVGLAIAAELADDPWRLETPEVGTSIAPVWLRNLPAHEVDQALADVTGCTSMEGRIDRSVPEAGAQHLLVWVLETRTTDAAEQLAAAAGPGEGSGFVAVSAVLGRVCAIVISRSYVAKATPFETVESLQRFGPLFDRALAAAG